MRRVWLSLLFTTAALPLSGAGPIPSSEYGSRRETLRKKLDGGLVLFGKAEGYDEVYGFIQEPNFYYLTGWNEPGAILLLTPDSETLFLPPHNAHRENYTGKRASAEDANAKEVTGFSAVAPVDKFGKVAGEALSKIRKIYALPGEQGAADLYANRVFGDARVLLAAMRITKSPAEIAAIQHATDVTVAGHKAAWKRMAPGLYEYQLAATLSYVYMNEGCERQSYAPIVGSGPNGAILHYSANSRRMDAGEIVVMDTAAECADYASDVTRSVPVNGKFTARERELYEVVLGAQKAAIAAIKPGVRMMGDENSLNKIAKDYINSHGKDSHGQPLGKYFIHGLGHPVGLDVHDPLLGLGDLVLQPGMIVTIEPGIYIPEESIGIRIEDVVLVTPDGARVLSAALPREPGEIEKALAR